MYQVSKRDIFMLVPADQLDEDWAGAAHSSSCHGVT